MNGPRRESILESQVVLLVAHALSLGLGLLITFILARRLDDDGFAGFIVLSGAIALASQLVDAGLQPAVIAELSRSRGAAWPFVRRVILQRCGLASVAVVLTLLAAHLLPSELETWLLLVAILVLPCRTLGAILAAGRRHRILAWGGLLIRAAFCLAIAVIAEQEGPVLSFVLIALLCREIGLSLYPCLALRWKPTSEASFAEATPLRGLVLLAVATMFSAAYFHIDVFMLRAMSDSVMVADYGLAVRVLGPMVVAVSLILAPFLPFLSKGLNDGEAPAPTDVALTAVAGLGTMLPLSMVLLISPPIIRIISGDHSEIAADSLATLAWAIPWVVVGIAFSTALIMARRYGVWAIITLVGLATNIGLNRLWIPDFGAMGAARATLFTEAVVCVLSVGFLLRGRSRSGGFTLKELGGAALASMLPGAIAMGAFLLLWPEDWNVRLAVAGVLAVLAAAAHMFVGVARTLRRHFEDRVSAREERR